MSTIMHRLTNQLAEDMEDSLTIIIPVYNEEGCLEPLFRATSEFLKRINIPTQILFINDGSTDNSAGLIEKICNQDGRFSFIFLERNRGLSTALKAGIDHCNTKFIGYMDADLQTVPADFGKLIQFKDEYELVMGYRKNRKDTVVKKLSSFLANSFKRWLLDNKIIDTGCPLKIIRTDIAKQLPFFRGLHRFIPDMVILLGGRVKQVPIQHFPRLAGKAKYNLINRMVGPFIDAFVFRWMQRNFIHYRVKKMSQNVSQRHEEFAQ